MVYKQQNRYRYTLMKASLFGSFGVLGMLITLALFVVQTIIHPRRRTLYDLYTFTPYELGLPGEAVKFLPQQGDYQVSGWYIPYPGASTTIVLSPGYRSKVEDVLRLAAPLWRAGHTILVFEYYGHGAPVGMPVTLGYRELNDYLGAIAYAKARAPQNRLGVFACSMGASVAIMAGAKTPDVEAFLLDSPFATHRRVLAYNFRRVLHLPFGLVAPLADQLLWLLAGYRFRQVEPLREIGRLTSRPVLLIQGGKDSVVDPQDADLLYQALGSPKEIWIVPEADHCCAYFVDRSAYLSRVINFFDLHLKQQQPLNGSPTSISRNNRPIDMA